MLAADHVLLLLASLRLLFLLLARLPPSLQRLDARGADLLLLLLLPPPLDRHGR